MPGYVTATDACAACGKLCTFNPVYVPSIRVHGVRKPVCGSCITAANIQRAANNLEPLTPHRQAYEPLLEEDLPL